MFSFFRIQDETNWDLEDGWIDGDSVSWRFEIPKQLEFLATQLASLIFDESEENFTNVQLEQYARHAEDLLNLIIPFTSAMSFDDAGKAIGLAFATSPKDDMEKERAIFASGSPPVFLTSLTLNELDSFKIVELVTHLVECSAYHDQGCTSLKWDLIEGKAPPAPIKNAGAILAAYGLYRLDKVLSANDQDSIFDVVCISGQLLGAAALRVGWDEGGSITKSENSRKGLEARWSSLNEVKTEIKDKYLTSGIGNKAAFIRKNRANILADVRLHGYGLIESNIDRTVRKWLSEPKFRVKK